MSEIINSDPLSRTAKRSAGWHILLLAWLVYAGAFFACSKFLVMPATDLTNYQLLDLGNKYAQFAGAAFGLASFLVIGIVYLLIRLFIKAPQRRLVAHILTVLGYAPWLVLGYDLVYREPRYAQVAIAIIDYLGQPMFFSAAIVCGIALLGMVLGLVLKKRSA